MTSGGLERQHAWLAGMLKRADWDVAWWLWLATFAAARMCAVMEVACLHCRRCH